MWSVPMHQSAQWRLRHPDAARAGSVGHCAGWGCQNQSCAVIPPRAFCQRIKGNKPFICLARDGRISSPQMAANIRRGITDSGVDVVDIGIGPTPMLYFAAHTMQADAAIMITGSHNPPTHNGLKCMLHGKPFFGNDIRALYPVVQAGQFAQAVGQAQLSFNRKGQLTACTGGNTLLASRDY
ncbi:MAG: hypothetical protein ACPGVS_10105, partial [Primorskyibacter sp.]